MILINKGVTNSVVMTLTEKSTLPAPNYLFSFTNDSDDTNKLFNMTDISGYPRRYNRFDLIETSSEDLSNGEVELKYGWGKYEVYESIIATLSISGTTGRILEEGKYYVAGYKAVSSFNNANLNNIYL